MARKIFIMLLLSGIVICSNNLVAANASADDNPALRERKMFHYLNANYPDEMKEIKSLMTTDPLLARKKLKALAEKGLARLKREQAEWLALIKQYRKTQSPVVLAKIRAKMVQNYQLRIRYRERMIANIEANLKRARQELKQFKSEQDTTIDKMIAKLKKVNSPQKKEK